MIFCMKKCAISGLHCPRIAASSIFSCLSSRSGRATNKFPSTLCFDLNRTSRQCVDVDELSTHLRGEQRVIGTKPGTLASASIMRPETTNDLARVVRTRAARSIICLTPASPKIPMNFCIRIFFAHKRFNNICSRATTMKAAADRARPSAKRSRASEMSRSELIRKRSGDATGCPVG